MGSGPGRGSVRRVATGHGFAWMATWMDARGKRRRRVVGATKAEAEVVLAKLIRDRDLERNGMGVDRGASMLVADLAAQYVRDLATRARPKSITEARAGLDRVLAGLGARTARDITAPAVLAWRARRVAEGAANKTANTEVGYLKAALSLAVRLGQLAANPLAGLRGLPVGGRHQVRRPRALSDWELRRLFQAADELDREAAERDSVRPENLRARPLPRAPLVRALALTGARWSELTAATWADFDPERGVLHLRAETTKNARPRVVPLVPELRDLIASLPALYAERLGRRPSAGSRVFLSPAGKPWDRGRQNFYRHLRDVFLRAGIAHKDELGRVVHVHALRHTFATRLARAGVPLAVAQKLTGHRTAAILLSVYTHLDDEEIRGALESLPTLGVASNLPRPSSAESASCAVGGAAPLSQELDREDGSPGRARTYNNPVNSRVVSEPRANEP